MLVATGLPRTDHRRAINNIYYTLFQYLRELLPVRAYLAETTPASLHHSAPSVMEIRRSPEME
jgi:hypothetical protein